MIYMGNTCRRIVIGVFPATIVASYNIIYNFFFLLLFCFVWYVFHAEATKKSKIVLCTRSTRCTQYITVFTGVTRTYITGHSMSSRTCTPCVRNKSNTLIVSFYGSGTWLGFHVWRWRLTVRTVVINPARSLQFRANSESWPIFLEKKKTSRCSKNNTYENYDCTFSFESLHEYFTRKLYFSNAIYFFGNPSFLTTACV